MMTPTHTWLLIFQKARFDLRCLGYDMGAGHLRSHVKIFLVASVISYCKIMKIMHYIFELI